MYILDITYKVALEQVDAHLQDHIVYLDEQYKSGHFILSGRKEPRTGGIILSPITDKELLMEIIQQDPFYKHQLADYNLIEFTPSKASEALSSLLPS